MAPSSSDLQQADLLARIAALPPAQRAEAMRMMNRAAMTVRPKGKSRRDPDQRRKFFGDPWKYIRDIFGYRMSSQQEEAVDIIEKYDRVLLLSGNNLGKTFIIATYGLYRYDVVAAMPDEYGGLEEQGCRLLLPGPDHDTIFFTIYSEILSQADRAEMRGYPMPGERSKRSVNWPVRPRWEMEAFAPRKDTKQEISHTASGRHHLNQLAIIEEGQGVDEAIWAAVEGMCSTFGNKIISPLNPSNRSGAVWTRLQSGAYRFINLDAFSHPNVKERALVIPAAISYRVVDGRVKTDCRDRGPYPDIQPDPEWRDIVYALPPKDDTPERGPRTDGQLGHPDGELHVFRPIPGTKFEPQILGQYPKVDDDSLFDAGKVEAMMLRGAKKDQPKGTPDCIGLDFARTGGDEICGCPRWGESADSLLRGYHEALKSGPEAVLEFVAGNRARTGRIRVLAQGDGEQVAREVIRLWPKGPLVGDIGGVGASPVDILNKILRRPITGISFGASSWPLPPGISSYPENLRTWLYIVAARACALGLVDADDDPMLKQELLATEVIHREKTIRVYGKPKRVPSVILISKDDIKKKIRRSPDKADAWVLSLTDGMGVRPRITWIHRKITRDAR